MTVPQTLVRKAHIHLPQAGAFVDWLLQHWRDEGIDVSQPQAGTLLLALADVGTARLQQTSASGIDCLLQPVAPRMGELMQLSLAEHLAEFADQMAWVEGSWELVWEGDAPPATSRLQVMRVLSNQALSPRMRRIRLAAGDISAFAPSGLHVRMLLPEPGQAPAWPTLADGNRLHWPAGKPALARRTYTISAMDPEEGWLEVDALLHHGTGHSDPHMAGPGAVWAASAEPDSEVGVLSPAGGMVSQAQHCVLVADACALPAAARIAQARRAYPSTTVLLWVSDAQEQAALLPAFSGINVTWLRGGVPGASQLEIAQVLQWLAQQDWHPHDTVLWVAGGLPLTQAVRRSAARLPSLVQIKSLVHTYWR
ncbi:siderophore-interacting protein [Comamonas sp. B-9]|uniref:siderophore-interacting protein n=1 Tax=Comamonas sp. B-9 TaxID=1055192 RepID=UPI00039552B8|nr:siderophore-interacting protein [Comamonas sp. B-9]